MISKKEIKLMKLKRRCHFCHKEFEFLNTDVVKRNVAHLKLDTVKCIHCNNINNIY